MARVGGIDVGARLGIGLIAPDEVRSGSFQFIDGWYPFGRQAVEWERRLQEQLDDFRFDHVGIARQFLRKGKKSHDTPKNLIPMYWAFGTVLKICHQRGIQTHWIQEMDARSLMLGKKNMPQKSEALKAAVNRACKDRGWPCCDYDASDALCIAAAVVEQLNPGAGHQTSPLFAAAP